MTSTLFLVGCQIIYWNPYPIIGDKIVGSWISNDGYFKLTFNYDNKFFLNQWTHTDRYCLNQKKHITNYKCKNKLYIKRYNNICLEGFYELKGDSLYLREAILKATENFSCVVFDSELLNVIGDYNILSDNYPVLIGTWSREKNVMPQKNPAIAYLN